MLQQEMLSGITKNIWYHKRRANGQLKRHAPMYWSVMDGPVGDHRLLI